MEHIFIVNPVAGKYNHLEEIKAKLAKYDKKISYLLYITKGPGDGIRYCRELMKTANPLETYRFYACGGDGTLNEVVNGVFGFKNAEVASYPIGSGNDFVKNFDDIKDFLDLDKMINGSTKTIDLIKVDDRYCANILNYGFDGEVVYRMLKFKKWPLMSGPAAYNLAAFTCLLSKMKRYLKVTVDGEVIFEGQGLLSAVCNGFCCGGGFYCAPFAKTDDGLIDIIIVKKIHLYQAPGFLKIYKSGHHLDPDSKLRSHIVYARGKHVTIEAKHPVAISIDGEVEKKLSLDATMVPGSLNIVLPQRLIKAD
jgi:diacylglycerol kinase (ATP)